MGETGIPDPEKEGSVIMPAVYAHYKFGKEVYRALPQDIRQLVKENAPAYWLEMCIRDRSGMTAESTAYPVSSSVSGTWFWTIRIREQKRRRRA